MISCNNNRHLWYSILYDIIIDTILCPHYICLAAAEAAEPPENQRADASDDDLDADRPMDFDEERDFADQGPLTDRDMEEDVQNLATLMMHLPSCMNTADIEQLLQDIPEQPPAVVPARTGQEAVDAGDLLPLDVDAANVFTQSERILQDHIRKHGNNSAEVKIWYKGFFAIQTSIRQGLRESRLRAAETRKRCS